MVTTSGIAMASSLLGLVFSYHLNTPSGPAIVLVAGFLYLGSWRSAAAACCGAICRGATWRIRRPARHLPPPASSPSSRQPVDLQPDRRYFPAFEDAVRARDGADASPGHSERRHSPISLLGDYLQAAGAKLTTLLPHNGDKLPATPEGFDGAVILGGPQHAHDDARFPAFLPMLDLLRSFHAQTKPLLGMCLGGQLMARAFGEKVRVNDTFEFGFLPIEITPEGREDPLLAGLAPRQRIMQWHEDTFGLPEGGVRLMTGETCANQAFRFGKTAYGFQCHWEVSMDLARDWVSNFGHVLQNKLGEAGAAGDHRACQGRVRQIRPPRQRFLPRRHPALGRPRHRREARHDREERPRGLGASRALGFTSNSAVMPRLGLASTSLYLQVGVCGSKSSDPKAKLGMTSEFRYPSSSWRDRARLPPPPRRGVLSLTAAVRALILYGLGIGDMREAICFVLSF